MKFFLKIVLLLIAVLATAIVLLPFVEQVINLSGLIVSDMRFLSGYSSVRIFSRLVMLFALIGFVVYKKELGLVSFKTFGMGNKKCVIHLFYGFLLPVILFIPLMATLVKMQNYRMDILTPYTYLLKNLVEAFGAALIIGFLEEIFFRGYLLKTSLDKSSLWFSFISINIIYAAVHFIAPSDVRVPENIPFYGIYMAKAIAADIFYNWSEYIMPFLGLFFLGLVFSFAFIRTGSLYLSIGLHAGVVFTVKADSAFVDNTHHLISPIIYNGNYVIGGVSVWGILVIISLLIWFFTRKKEKPIAY